MLHVGEVKFTPGWILFEIQLPFTSGWKLKISTLGWNGYFDLSAWCFTCFHFIKIQIVISDKLYVGRKENSCAYRFYISHCCKYCLLALYSCIKYEGGNWKIKGNTEIYSLLSKLNFQYFCSRTWHLERKSNFSNLYKTFTAISATKHGLINKLIA